MPSYTLKPIFDREITKLQLVDNPNQLLPIMLYPEDEYNRERISKCLHYYSMQMWLNANPEIDSVPKSIALEMARYGSIEGIDNLIRTEHGAVNDQGEEAAAFLMYAFRIGDVNISKISRTMLIDSLKSELDIKRRKQSRRLDVKNYAEQSFNKFRSVAHLWAAYKMFRMGEQFGPYFPCHPDHFDIFVWLSESIRLRGESFYLKGEAKPILDGGMTWKPDFPVNLDDSPYKFNWVETPEGITAALSKIKGRPREYDWAAFDHELDRLLDHHGGPCLADPDMRNKASVKRAMIDWCLQEWGFEPSDTMIKGRVAAGVERYKQRR